MLKKLTVTGLILAAAAVMGLISYSFLSSNFFARAPAILIEGTGAFWEADRPPQGPEEAPTLGFLAPDFTLADVDGRAVTLSGLRGRPLLLNMWATWCPPCRYEMPDLQAFHRRFSDQVTVLGVNWAEDPDTVRAFLDRYGITYPNVLDRQGKVFVAYRLTGIPTSFFIDERGVIRGVWAGPLSAEGMVNGFAKITRAFRPSE